MSKRREIFLFGASGHAKVVADIIEREGRYRISAFYDDDIALHDRAWLGYTVVGGRDALRSGALDCGVVCIGPNDARQAVAQWLLSRGLELVTAIHPAAVLGSDVGIGPGCVVMAGVVINPAVRVGMNCIVNTGATLDHDCRIGDHVHLAPGSVLCGNVTVGEATFVGAGTTVLPNLVVGRGVTIGAGSTVIEDLPDGVMVAGTPARVIKSSQSPK